MPPREGEGENEEGKEVEEDISLLGSGALAEEDSNAEEDVSLRVLTLNPLSSGDVSVCETNLRLLEESSLTAKRGGGSTMRSGWMDRFELFQRDSRQCSGAERQVVRLFGASKAREGGEITVQNVSHGSADKSSTP